MPTITKRFANKKFTVYQDKDQWIPYLNWFWMSPAHPTPDNMGHGPFPAKFIATLSAKWSTRNDGKKRIPPAKKDS